MITIREHQRINPSELQSIDWEKLKRCVNYNTSAFVASKINLIRYEFDPNPDYDGFWSYFRIGAEWLDNDQTESIIVLPKIQKIDFIEMFMTCLKSSQLEDNFSNIYDIDLESKPIKSNVLNSILSPLLIVQYLLIVKQISDRGLRKGYVFKEDNLNKVRGRINFRKNEILNIRTAHKERVYCKYNEFSVDYSENRYLKRALIIASDMISLMEDHKSYSTLKALSNQCLSAFSDVSDSYEDYKFFTRNNKLFKEYDDALRFAKMIIRKEEMAVNSNKSNFDLVPVFRIDMALLFEHYVLAKLRDNFGFKHIIYQRNAGKQFIPDFLITKGDLKVIADAKYIELYENSAYAKGEYIKQLCGYARDKRILKSLNVDCNDEERIPIVPCTLIYPTIEKNNVNINLLPPEANRVNHIIKFNTTSIKIPTI